jgi:hypothetical protein
MSAPWPPLAAEKKTNVSALASIVVLDLYCASLIPASAPWPAAAEVAELLEQFGSNGPAMGLLQNQLALWSFYCAEYGDAVAAARAAQQVWVS